MMSKNLLVKSKCPECGANLKVDVQAEHVRCEYCGTTARVADKKKPKPPPSQQTPEPVIWVSTGGISSWVWILSYGLPILISGIVFISTAVNTPLGNMMGFGDDSKSSPGSGGSAGQSFGEHMQWVSHKQPMLADITGDSVMDIIGWIRFLNMGGGTTYDHIGAFNPVTGDRIWDTGPIASSDNTSGIRVALAMDKLLVADTTGVLKAYALGAGTLVWQAVLGERTDGFCSAAQGFADLHAKDKRILRVNLANGQIAPAGQWDSDTPCVPLQNDDDRVGPYFTTSDRLSFGSSVIKGMDMERLVTDTSTGNVTALGNRTPGTRAPVAAGVKVVKQGKRGRNMKATANWIASVTTLNPLTLDEGAPEFGAAAAGRTVVAYDMKGSKAGTRLSCLDQTNGALLWDIVIPRSDTGSIGSITVSNHHVFVGHWTYMDIFQLVDGVHKMTIGIW